MKEKPSNKGLPKRLLEHVGLPMPLSMDEWSGRHKEHGGMTIEPFPKPDGKVFKCVCLCGAIHFCTGRMEPI